LSDLKTRQEAYAAFGEKFSFLLNLAEMEEEDILKTSKILTESFPEDFSDEAELKDELKQFVAYIKKKDKKIEVPKNTSIQQFYKWFINSKLNSVYPIIDIIFKICLCTPATNCSAERSFSVLKRIKDYLRNKTEQDRLQALAILCIESEIALSLDYELIIDKFAESKARKKKII
jgi:uncharacterized membrane protein YgaE (UPF0421/DUF939 family)